MYCDNTCNNLTPCSSNYSCVAQVNKVPEYSTKCVGGDSTVFEENNDISRFGPIFFYFSIH